MKRYALASVAIGICLSCALAAAQCDVEALFASPGADGAIKQRIIAELDAADTQILIALYSFADDDLGAAVVRAHQRGVNVYVLLDENQEAGAGGEELPKLMGAGIRVGVEHEVGRLYQGFVVVDQETVILGSYDWSDDADDFEHVAILECTTLAEQYAGEFQRIANGVLDLGWIALRGVPVSASIGSCGECLARLNAATADEFEECSGIDRYLAFRLESYQPFTTYYCSRATLETILFGVPSLEEGDVAKILDCICEGLLD